MVNAAVLGPTEIETIVASDVVMAVGHWVVTFAGWSGVFAEAVVVAVHSVLDVVVHASGVASFADGGSGTGYRVLFEVCNKGEERELLRVRLLLLLVL